MSINGIWVCATGTGDDRALVDMSGREVVDHVDLRAGDADGDDLDQRPDRTPTSTRTRRTPHERPGAPQRHPDREAALAKAAVLAEALPWLERFHGRDRRRQVRRQRDDRRRAQARRSPRTWCSCALAGLRPVVVHGGGPQITAMLDRLGIAGEFRGGYRVTTPEAMDVVRMVLIGQVQREVVGLINAHGPYAVGLSGEDAHLFTAERRDVLVDGEPIDIGLVGDVVDVRPDFVTQPARRRARSRSCPRSRAATTATSTTSTPTPPRPRWPIALGAEKLVVLTDVEGLYADWPASDEVIRRSRSRTSTRLLPVARERHGARRWRRACAPCAGGVPRAHVIDGRVPHARAARGVHHGRRRHDGRAGRRTAVADEQAAT